MRRRLIALGAVAVIIVAAFGVILAIKYANTTTTSLDTTFTTKFYYPISVNYSGSWNLVYWAQNGTVTQQNAKGSVTVHKNTLFGDVTMLYNIVGNLTGSGYYERTIVTYGVGYVENTFCAKATKLDSQSLTLTLTVVGKTNSTTTSNPSAEACLVYAV